MEIGKRYELIHTGYVGLYRHRMGDVLEAPQSGRPDIPEQEAAQTMDQMLRRYNIDYDDCRRLKEIWPVRVHFLKNGTTNLHMESLRLQGMDVSQYKPVRIIDTPEKKAFFFGQIL